MELIVDLRIPASLSVLFFRPWGFLSFCGSISFFKLKRKGSLSLLLRRCFNGLGDLLFSSSVSSIIGVTLFNFCFAFALEMDYKEILFISISLGD